MIRTAKSHSSSAPKAVEKTDAQLLARKLDRVVLRFSA